MSDPATLMAAADAGSATMSMAESAPTSAAPDNAMPGQTTIVASLDDSADQGTTSIDALNRGITQSSDIKPVSNLYSTAAPATGEAAPDQGAALAPDATTSTASLAVPENAPIPTASPAAPQVPAMPQAATADQAPAAAQAAVAEAAAPEAEEPAPVALAVVAPPKKQSIFSRLFSAKPEPKRKAAATNERKIVQPVKQVQLASVAGDNTGALPGVRTSELFEIKSGTDEDGEDAAGVEMASAAGLARLSPNGLHLQTDKVDVACLKPNLVRVLNSIERHYGRDVVVTSGFRNPKHNRRIGGATGSKHTSCEAADIQVAGVSKWELAKYLRTMPGRGGVGTYCHTESVHVDIGTPRDWNWRCRRRK